VTDRVCVCVCVCDWYRAWIAVSQVYLISEKYPSTNKLRKGFDVATAELHRHIELLRLLLCQSLTVLCGFCHYQQTADILE